jgi:hypothetical protein
MLCERMDLGKGTQVGNQHCWQYDLMNHTNWLIYKTPTFKERRWGTQLRHPRDPTKLLFAWGGRIRENFVGADDLAVEGTRN